MIVDRLFAVPGAPPFVRGVTSLRGEIIAIVDAAPALGLPERALAGSGKALVLEPASLQVAMAVDEVLGLETFDEFRPPEDSAVVDPGPAGTRWLERDGRLVAVLDVPEIVEALKARLRQGTGSGGHGPRKDGGEGP